MKDGCVGHNLSTLLIQKTWKQSEAFQKQMKVANFHSSVYLWWLLCELSEHASHCSTCQGEKQFAKTSCIQYPHTILSTGLFDLNTK